MFARLRNSPEDELKREFNRRKPWVTKFWLGDRSYGGNFDAFNDPRVDLFFQEFAGLRKVLELGSLEGGHTLNIARRPGIELVMGIEGREENIARAEFIQSIYQVSNVTFKLANLEHAQLSDWGQFDAVFCVGLLYHLPEPWKLIQQIASVAPNVFMWTHYALPARARLSQNGYPGLSYREFGRKDVLSGLSPKSFWPTLPALVDMLCQAGFVNTRILVDEPAHVDGPAVTLAASQAPGGTPSAFRA